MYMGFAERLALRRRIAKGIADGDLPSQASVVLYNPDAFSEIERQTVSKAAGASHPILAWIAANWQIILQDVLAILPLFGVNVPPIHFPTPGTTTPAPKTSGDPTQPMAMMMELPSWVEPLVEQIVAQAVQQVLPMVETKIKEWADAHVGKAA